MPADEPAESGIWGVVTDNRNMTRSQRNAGSKEMARARPDSEYDTSNARFGNREQAEHPPGGSRPIAIPDECVGGGNTMLSGSMG